MIGDPLPVFPGAVRKNDAVFLYGATREKPFIMTYEQPATEIICGPSCRREKEVNVQQCISDDVPVFERRGGGGTVVLSKGMVVCIVVGNRSAGMTAVDYFDTVHNRIIALLEPYCRVKIQRNGISDLTCNGRKILGSSLYMGTRPFKYYYQSSLLVEPDLSLFDKYLYHPPREPDYRQQRSHSNFCTTLAEQGCMLNVSEVATQLSEGLKVSLV